MELNYEILNLQTLPVVPIHRREIVVRGPAPPFCRVLTVPERRGANVDGGVEAIKNTFYGIARPAEQIVENAPIYSNPEILSQEPPSYNRDPPLCQAERDVAVDMIQRAGPDGIDVLGRDLQLVWMPKCPRGWGQSVKRVSDQLSVKRAVGVRKNGSFNYKYDPICTYLDCFNYIGTRVAEENPKCVLHKGPYTGFVVFEYEILSHPPLSVLQTIEHRFVSFTYLNDSTREEHMRIGMQNFTQSLGQEVRRQFFNAREDAEKTYALWKTSAMFMQLHSPSSFRYKGVSISLAIGLEDQLKQELRTRYGLQLEVTAILQDEGESRKISFPFGIEARETDKLADLVSSTHGALYVICDDKIMYGGQCIDKGGCLHRATDLNDTINNYKRLTGGNPQLIPIASVQKGVKSRNLFKMESHLHVALYLAYLFRLRNPFHQNYQLYHPYSINKETNSNFDNLSWNMIQQFVFRKFGVKIELCHV